MEEDTDVFGESDDADQRVQNTDEYSGNVNGQLMEGTENSYVKPEKDSESEINEIESSERNIHKIEGKEKKEPDDENHRITKHHRKSKRTAKVSPGKSSIKDSDKNEPPNNDENNPKEAIEIEGQQENTTKESAEIHENETLERENTHQGDIKRIPNRRKSMRSAKVSPESELKTVTDTNVQQYIEKDKPLTAGNENSNRKRSIANAKTGMTKNVDDEITSMISEIEDKNSERGISKSHPKTKRHSRDKEGLLNVKEMKGESTKMKVEKGRELLLATKNKQKAEALKLVEEGADVFYVDETKHTVLHYAASAGYDDLISKVISEGASVKIWDDQNETPLHKAARNGHETTVVLLVANGADVSCLNQLGKNSLELAVSNKHVGVIEALCLFGTDILMQDWTWLESTMKSKDKKDQAIVDIIVKHYERITGYRHGGIVFNVMQIKSGEKDTKLEKIDVTLIQNEYKTPFLFYCCKMHVEYTNVKQMIKEDEELFSDVYECKSWGSSKKVFTLEVKLSGIPNRNETIYIFSPDGKVGRVDSISRNEDENFTIVIVTINIKYNATTSFVFVTKEKQEVFAVSKEAITIQPQMEPDAEIHIPENTFDMPGDLLLSVVETKDVNVAENDSTGEIVLVTNVLDLSVSNHQQPKQAIDMKMPMHQNVGGETEIAILSSSKEYPEEPEDWEIVEAKNDSRKRCAEFKINHFSIFTGVSKSKLEKEMKEVTTLIQKALNNERQVEFFVMMKTISRNEFLVVVECCLQRKAKHRRKYWRKKDYESGEIESFAITVQVNSWFRVKFDGNIQQLGGEQMDAQKILFNANRENFTISTVEVIDPKLAPRGNMNIALIVEKEQEPMKVIETRTMCIGGKVKIIPRDPVTEYQELTIFPLQLNPLPTQEEDEKDIIPLSKYDVECDIDSLKISSLVQLYRRLNMDEMHHLAIQLKVYTWSELAMLSTEVEGPEKFLVDMFKKWRGKRPFLTQIEFLSKALDSMDKQYEANEVRLAHQEKREICFL